MLRGPAKTLPAGRTPHPFEGTHVYCQLVMATYGWLQLLHEYSNLHSQCAKRSIIHANARMDASDDGAKGHALIKPAALLACACQTSKPLSSTMSSSSSCRLRIRGWRCTLNFDSAAAMLPRCCTRGHTGGQVW
jgi:hypothetical protein